MKSLVNLDLSNTLPFFEQSELNKMNGLVKDAHHTLHTLANEGSFGGWLEWPFRYDQEEFKKMQEVVEVIRGNSEILLVIGTGGSYNGARAAINMLTHSFHNEVSFSPNIIFVGQNLSSTYLGDIVDLLQGKDWSINVVSKSGTTLEPALAFRMFKKLLEKQYGKEEAKKRIYVTTDNENGILRKMANDEGYESFVIPENIGGRYSVLTSVGLLPMAVSGINIEEVMEGASSAYEDLLSSELSDNQAYQYAAIRNLLYQKGKTVELLAHYEPCLDGFAEWWKQLFAESEGKEGKGIFPVSASFTTDLHSFGQYIQDGTRNLLQTVIYVEKPRKSVLIEEEVFDRDELNYLSGKTIEYVNRQAFEGALQAHTESGVPNFVLHVSELTPYTFGYLAYFFQKACAISALILGVNPFDQPGVEAYKRNMYKLLEKGEKGQVIANS